MKLKVLALLLSAAMLAACGGGSTEDREEAQARGGKGKPVVVTNVLPDGSLSWAHPNTWGGVLPTVGAEVIIPAGKVITLDTNSPELGNLKIEGTLRFARKDVTLTATSISVAGALEIGTATQPFAQKATITVNGQPEAVNNGFARGIMVMGGQLALYGAVKQPAWTKINEHIVAGTSAAVLKDSVNWKVSDTVVVGPTDYRTVATTQLNTLATVSGNALTFASPISQFRWGKLQYATNTGMSLTPDPTFVPAGANGVTMIDQRAVVGNLTRNIVIQGPDDAAWQTNGFGAHTMVMGLTSKVVIDGVEFKRSGQAGVTGRYPFHWHMLSYDPNGILLGDATGHVIKNSTVNVSSNRCITIHGTNGVSVLNNICYDIKGHAFFLEDAVERRNKLDGNLAIKVNNPMAGKQLMVHEGNPWLGGPSGFWLTNPDNLVTNNYATDTKGNGFWMAFPSKPLGLSKLVPFTPNNLKHGGFDNNSASSAGGPGILLEMAPIDDLGNVYPISYAPTTDGTPFNYQNGVPFTLSNNTAFKNLFGAYKNRAIFPNYDRWAVADNYGLAFSGQVSKGTITNTLTVGRSLNDLTPYPTQWMKEEPTAFASYHSTLNMKDNTIINYPFVEGKTSGAFSSSDHYISAVDKGLVRNSNNKMINTHPGFRTLPPLYDGQPLERRFWTYAGALWDAHGYWGNPGQYTVYDMPFLTWGATCQWMLPEGKNGKSCNGEYYGVGGFQTDFDMRRYSSTMAVNVKRLDDNGNLIGTWDVPDGANGSMLTNMRHFAGRKEGRYILTFPGHPIPKEVYMGLSNLYRAGDTLVLAVSFDGTLVPSAYTTSIYNRETPMTWASTTVSTSVLRVTMGTSLQEVIDSPRGTVMWQDAANNLVWVKVVGGVLSQQTTFADPIADEALYRGISLVIYPKR